MSRFSGFMIVIIELYKKILKILNSPHTLTYNIKNVLFEAGGLGLLVFLILYLFYPDSSDINLSTAHILINYFSFGLLTFFISSIYLYSIPRIAPEKINESNWTTKKEIISILVLIILISSGNFFLVVYWDLSEFTITNYLYTVLETLKIGLIPIVAAVLIEQKRRLKQNLKSAIAINAKLNNFADEKKKDDVFSLRDENGKPAIEFKISELYFIKSAGNYVEVHLMKNGLIKPTLLRSSLKKIENQLSSLEGIIKCHRMYLVNIKMISYAEGNSQGYKLFIKESEYEIPVSRNYIKDLKKRITSMQLG